MTLTLTEAESATTSGGKVIGILFTTAPLEEGEAEAGEDGLRIDETVYDFFKPSGSTRRMRST